MIPAMLVLLMLATMAPTTPPMPERTTPFVRSTPAPRDEVRVTFAADATVEGYTATFWSLTPGFTVDPARLRVDRTALDGTVLSRDVGATVGTPETRMGPPGPPQTVRLRVEVPRSTLQPGMQNLALRLETGAVMRDGAYVSPKTYAITSSVHVDVSDRAGDDALRRRFVGKMLYGYGPLALRCGVDAIPYAALITQPHAALRIARLDRIKGAVPTHAGYDTSDDAFAFKAIDPLRVVFDLSVRPKMGGASFSYPIAPAPSPHPSASATSSPTPPMTPSPLPGRLISAQNHAVTRSIMDQIRTTGCRSLDIVAAGAWQLERLVTTVAPTPGLNDIRLGLSHEQVAEIAGFPSVYATKAELMRLSEWRYDRPAPFSSSVTFDGDRVVRYQPPGNLP